VEIAVRINLKTRRRFLFASVIAFVCSAGALWAQQARSERHLALDGRIEADGSAVHLSWRDAEPPRVGAVVVKRRHLGDVGGDSWRMIAPGLGPVLHFTDETTEPGVAYEYQVLRLASDIVDVGYWTTGVDVPAKAVSGTVLLVVEESIAVPLDARLKRFEFDLMGDGWRVVRHETPRGRGKKPVENLARARAVKEWVRDRYLENPQDRYALVLVGQVPIVKSGNASPGGHGPTAHASDLFYADVDGLWVDNGKGLLGHNQLPNDFIEMQVGRIDFSNMKVKGKNREVEFLRAYFDKNHHWRQGLIGDLRTAYGQNDRLTGEQYGLRNIVGPQAVTPGGHHDVGEERPWLLGVDFGAVAGRKYFEKYANKAVFTINFGSGKQRIEKPFNAMRALLAQPWYPIACGWGGRPAWWLHHMALGATIGESHMRTVNNGVASESYRDSMDYFPTGQYLWRNPIWVNLLGDPTTRAFMLSPPRQARAWETGQGVALSWAASSDPSVIGYRIYRAAATDGAFTALEAGAVVEGTEYLDTAPLSGARYMIRAYGVKRVYAGTFFTFSQGAFAEVGRDPVQAVDRTVTAVASQPIRLMEGAGTLAEGGVQAFVEGPVVGQLKPDGDGWLYTPPVSFKGPVRLRFSVSDELSTDDGILTIVVGD
jgi:hypothetical protein